MLFLAFLAANIKCLQRMKSCMKQSYNTIGRLPKAQTSR